MSKTSAFLVVIGKDKPGIIAETTGVLFKNQCNLEDISMTVLEGTLAMILIVQYPPARKKKLEDDCRALAKKTGLSMSWQPAAALKPQKENWGNQTFLISAMGKDRTGIVYHVSQVLAKKKLNITDLNSRVLASGKQKVYAMMLEVEAPKSFQSVSLEKELAVLAKKLGVEIQCKPVERLSL